MVEILLQIFTHQSQTVNHKSNSEDLKIKPGRFPVFAFIGNLWHNIQITIIKENGKWIDI